MNKLKGLTAYVTGGASGIGRAVVERIICEGGRVCIADVNREGDNIVKNMGDKAMFIPTDVTQECDVIDSLNQTAECFGKIDVVVNSAGCLHTEKIYNFKSEIPHSENGFRSVIETNLWGTFNVTRLAAGILSKNKPDEHRQRGVIINLGSIMSFDAPADYLAYGATKAAVTGMTIPLARGLAPKGIRVVAVCPGLVDTPMTKCFTKEDLQEFHTMLLSPKSTISPDEIAHLVQTIVENPAINAENIRIDCGWRYNHTSDAKEIFPDKLC